MVYTQAIIESNTENETQNTLGFWDTKESPSYRWDLVFVNKKEKN